MNGSIRGWSWIATLAWAVSGSLGSTALAQNATPSENPAGEETDQAARLLFQSGVDAYQNGQYETALQRFRQAYELSQRPALLYNIGTTLDRLRRDEETIQTFEAYLAADPDTNKRAEVEARLRLLREQVEARQAQDAARQAELEREREAREAAEQTATAPTWDSTQATDAGAGKPIPLAVFIAAGGVAVALGAVGVGFGLRTKGLNDDYEATTDPAAARRAYDDALQSQRITNGMLFSAAGVAVATAVIAFFTDFGGGSSDDAAEAVEDGEETGDEPEAVPEAPAEARLRTIPSFAAGPGGFTFDLVHRF